MGQALPKAPGKFCLVIKVIMSPRGGETLKVRLRKTRGSLFLEIFGTPVKKVLKNLLQLDQLECMGWARDLQSRLLTHEICSWKALGGLVSLDPG